MISGENQQSLRIGLIAVVAAVCSLAGCDSAGEGPQISKTTQPEEVRASHILIATGKLDEEGKAAAKVRIEELLRKIRGGANFGELAKGYSDCPSKGRGGDLGYFKKGMMVKEFEDAAFGLDVGEVSNVVETKFGYHLIKLTGQKPPIL